jgi:hypothetical protein
MGAPATQDGHLPAEYSMSFSPPESEVAGSARHRRGAEREERIALQTSQPNAFAGCPVNRSRHLATGRTVQLPLVLQRRLRGRAWSRDGQTRSDYRRQDPDGRQNRDREPAVRGTAMGSRT